jgi:hypothetical protein
MRKNLKMDIYTATTGVEMTIKWANEEEYQLGRKFLTDMGADCGSSRGTKPEFFYLKNKQQLEALYEFRQALKEERKT